MTTFSEPSMAADRWIAVGDIHGCPQQLREILELGKKYPDHRWIFLGDYIDRGPDSEGVISLLRTLNAVFLLGNHEQMFLQRIQGAHSPALKKKWLEVVGISEESAAWLTTVPTAMLETPEYIFVHGGLDIDKPLDQQTAEDYLWIRHEGDYWGLTDKLVIHGHHSVDEPMTVGNRFNINTDCGRGGPLTALVLPEMRFLQSSRSEEPPAGHRLTPGDLAALVDNVLDELPEAD